MNLLIPKKKRIVVYGGANLNDNNEAMFSYLLNETRYTVICIADKHRDYKLRTNVRFVKNSYFNAIVFILSSTVIIDCSYHTIKAIPTKKQMFLQMWHGSPLKYMNPSSGLINHGDLFSLFLYSAEIFKHHMKDFFGVTEKKMFLNGNPRCDYLFKERPDESHFTIIWLPTYRKSKGRVQTHNDIPLLDCNNAITLDYFLEEQDVDLYIKPHPMQSVPFEKTIGSRRFKRIHIINDEYLYNKQLSLYEFLAKTDALITDYSSVYYDYLLANRPICFAIDDFDEYGKNTGYAFNDPLKYMPGAIAKTYDDLCEFIEDSRNGIDNYKSDRERVNNIVNYYKDNKNCERCVEILKKYL